MSSEAYARALSREAGIWTPFMFTVAYADDQNTERAMVFGLYSDAFRNTQGYLVEIEAEQLAQILADYNQKMAGLSADEQIEVSKIVTKRYLAYVDVAVHDLEIQTKEKKADSESEMWDAKFAALDADRAALVTEASKVAAEAKRIQARIEVLQAEILIEGINQSMVDIEISEKEIELSKKSLAILSAANDIIKIQLDIIETGMKMVDIDLQVAKTSIGISEANAQIAKTPIIQSELDIAISQVAAANAELLTYDSKLALVDDKKVAVGKEISHVDDLVNHEQSMQLAKRDQLSEEHDAKIYSITSEETRTISNLQHKEDSSENEVTIAGLEKEATATIDAQKLTVNAAQISAASSQKAAAIDAAETIAGANMITTLTHQIGGK